MLPWSKERQPWDAVELTFLVQELMPTSQVERQSNPFSPSVREVMKEWEHHVPMSCEPQLGVDDLELQACHRSLSK